MARYDILLKNAMVVDPLSNREELADLATKDGKIAEIGQGLSSTQAEESFDLSGYYVMPGIIDTHSHVSAWLGGKYGHKMMAQMGVTTALDMSGPMESVLDIARDHGVGLNIASIEYVRPGDTVSGPEPQETELRDFLARCLQRGSIGWKLLGGHYPLTPDASARCIRIANGHKCYIAFHAGTTNMGSNIDGFLEAVELADGNALHMCHVNAYCRGLVRPYMIETEEVLAALEKNPRIRSESYNFSWNGTSAKCSHGIPESMITRRCLATGGFDPTEEGFEKAVLIGWAQINMESGGKMMLAKEVGAVGQEAVDYWRSKGTDTTVSFSVNPPEPRIRLVTAKRSSGKFVVDCISTDGGGIPRNVILEMGLSLVKLQALSLKEFVQKTSTNPARFLGLKNKGHLTPGADADITVIDLAQQRAHMSVANGKVIMYQGYVCGTGSHIVTTAAGEAYIREKGLEPIVVDLEQSAFYEGI